MAFNVDQFRSNLVLDGARPNLFEVDLHFPAISPNASYSTRFMAKASQLPGSTVGTVPMYYFGRELKFPGNRTFADWTLTIINDEDFQVRNSLEAWMNSINSHAGNFRNPQGLTPASYSADANVFQYGKTGDVIKEYSFVGMFPVDISPIDLDWGSNDTMEEFQVTFAYQYWESATTS